MGLRSLFGKKLKEIREKRGLTQQKLAELCDMQTNSIGLIEIGKTAASFDTIEILSEILDVDYKDLFDFSSEFNIENSENEIIKSLYKKIKNFDKKTLNYLLAQIKLLSDFTK